MITIPLSPFHAAIFDMDGTMVNNMDYHKKAWRAFFEQYELSFTEKEFEQKISGKKNNQILELVFGKKLSTDEIKKHTEEKETLYRQIYQPKIKEVAGLHQVIAELKQRKIKLAIATTAPQKNRELILKSLKLENTFEIILGDEHVTHGKPNPEIYLETAKQLGINPSNCFVFEDSPPGIEAGKNAGMVVIAILTSHTKESLHIADYIVKDFTEIQFV